MTSITTEGSARAWRAFASGWGRATVLNPQCIVQNQRCKSALRGEGRALPGQAGRGAL